MKMPNQMSKMQNRERTEMPACLEHVHGDVNGNLILIITITLSTATAYIVLYWVMSFCANPRAISFVRCMCRPTTILYLDGWASPVADVIYLHIKCICNVYWQNKQATLWFNLPSNWAFFSHSGTNSSFFSSCKCVSILMLVCFVEWPTHKFMNSPCNPMRQWQITNNLFHRSHSFCTRIFCVHRSLDMFCVKWTTKLIS